MFTTLYINTVISSILIEFHVLTKEVKFYNVNIVSYKGMKLLQEETTLGLLKKILEISHKNWLKTRKDHYSFVKSSSHSVELMFSSDWMKA